MYWCILVLLLVPHIVYAEAVVCGSSATTGKFSRFLPSADLSRFVAGSTETCNHIRGDAATALQIDLYNTVPVRHIKVVVDTVVGEGVQPLSMAEMSPGEKQQVDDTITTKVNEKKAWQAEADTPGVCKYNTPAEIDTKTAQVKAANQTNINSMSLSASDKQALITVTNRLSEGLGQAAICDAARAGGG